MLRACVLGHTVGYRTLRCAPHMLKANCHFQPATRKSVQCIADQLSGTSIGRHIERCLYTKCPLRAIKHGTSQWSMSLDTQAVRVFLLSAFITGRVAQCQSYEGHSLARLDHPQAIIIERKGVTEPVPAWPSSVIERICHDVNLVRRLMWIGCLFFPVTFLYPIARLLSTNDSEATGGLPAWWWTLLCLTLERVGPTAIKFAQWASTRRDIFPTSLCENLARLHDSGTPHPFAHTQAKIELAFNTPMTEMFEWLEEEPIGSGCVGQVHKGLLHTGTHHTSTVAVKVLHPHVVSLISLDLDIMAVVARFITRFPGMKWFGLVDSVKQFSQTMSQQLDLQIEAQHLVTFNENFAGDPSAIFPQPVYPYASREVLIETFEQGQPISQFIPRPGEQQTPDQVRARKRLARSGLHTFLRMVLVDRFVHGDLHPGNILVREDPMREGSEYTGLVFLDAGIVTELDDRDGDNFYALFDAIVQNDGKKAGRLMLDNARESECDDPDAFCNEISKLVNTVHTTSLSLAHVDVGVIMTKVLTLVRHYKVMIEPNYASLVLGIVVMEGLGHSLDPDLDIIQASLPVLALARLRKLLLSLQATGDDERLKEYVWDMLNLHNGLVT